VDHDVGPVLGDEVPGAVDVLHLEVVDVLLEAVHEPGADVGIDVGVRVGDGETVSRGRAAMESWFVPTVARLGAQDPQTAAYAIAACFEGLVLHRIARHDDTDPRPAFALVVRAALT